jgi:cytochrome c peroxidase
MDMKYLMIAVTAASLSVTIVGTSHARHGKHGDGIALPSVITDSDYYENGAPNPAKVELGKNLYYDKILSGNKNIACATCHHSLTDTSDGLSLPLGEGGHGLGVARDTGTGADAVHERVPRNAPQVFNLGAREYEIMFHDGRVAVDASQPSGFRTPAGDNFPTNLENVLAAQAMFPVTSGTEMAGQEGENPIADAAALGNLAGPGGVWEQLAGRLQDPENGYVDMFIAAFVDVNSADDITMGHAANAIGAFEGTAFRADNTPFDRYLRGKSDAMSSSARRGMNLFYGKANCSSCHSGKFLTDHSFHAVAMPQIGPGRGDGFDSHEDFGREQVTGNQIDRHRFRTPPLRNIALHGPWGHAGAYNTLEAAVRHMVDPVNSLYNYDTSQAVLPPRADLDVLDFIVMNDPSRVDAIAATNELAPVFLSEAEFSDLMDFMNALTDPNSVDIRNTVPRTVPSGLPLAD